MPKKVYLGLDSGATKTEVAVLADDGRVLTQQIAGPYRMSARRATPVVVTRTREVIEFALAQAGAQWGDVAHFGFGMAGVDYDDEIPTQKKTLFAGLGIPLAQGTLVNDGIVALWGGSGKQRAVILQLGTAFTAAYRSELGGEAPFDQLNAGVIFDLRHAVLTSTARVWDGRLPESILPGLVLEHFEETDPTKIVKKFARHTIDKWKLLTVISPWRVAVERRDKVALMIVERAAEVYAQDVCFMLSKVGGDGADVVLGGGQLLNGPKAFHNRIAQVVRRQFPRVTVHGPHLSPAVGGAILAAYQDGAPHREFYRNAKKSVSK